MSPALLVRPVVAADFARWAPLWEGYNRFYERLVPAEITAVSWSRFLDSSEPMHALVAEEGEQLIGLAHFLFHRNTTMIEPACYLQDLFTAEAARKKGVGRALIEAVATAARRAGSPRLYWHTHETNQTARRLYDQLAVLSGFVQYRRTP